MTPRGPVVIDTEVLAASLIPGSDLSARAEPLIVGRPVFISIQTAAELRYGAKLRDWGSAHMRRLEAHLAFAEIVHSGLDLIEVYAQLRVDCQRAGAALAQREHDADRWIAATAVRLGLPLVSNDGIFKNAPGLTRLGT